MEKIRTTLVTFASETINCLDIYKSILYMDILPLIDWHKHIEHLNLKTAWIQNRKLATI